MLQDIDPQYLCETPRFKKLAQLEAYFDGTQYDKLPDWYTTDDVPLRDRRPCVIYPLPKAAVNQAVRFSIGEGKFPRLSVDEVEAADALTPALAISKDQSEIVSKAIEDIVRRSRLRSALRVAMRRGLSCGTAVMVLSIREGAFKFEHPKAKDCIPTFDNGDPEDEVVSLVWSYQYDEVEPDKDGHPQCTRYAFRRDYDAINVTEYEKAKIETGKDAIEWKIAKETPHGLGFCPVIWTRNLPDECGSDIDGVSLYDGLLDELDALNYSLSQRHSGLDILGTPQPYETGVEDGDGPGATARSAAPAARDPRANGYTPMGPMAKTGKSARKAGPNHLWSYEGTEVKVGLVETTGKAFEVASAHVHDIRSRLLEAMDIILMDPTTIAGKGDLSAKALALMHAPLLALVDELREWWWEHSISRLLEMMLRAVSVLGVGVLVRGGAKVAEFLAGRTIAVDGEQEWQPPDICPLWGAYFATSATEVQATVMAATTAKQGGLISAATASQYVASDFSVDDIDEELEDIKEEKADAVAEQQKQMAATGQPGAPKPGMPPKPEPQPADVQKQPAQ